MWKLSHSFIQPICSWSLSHVLLLLFGRAEHLAIVSTFCFNLTSFSTTSNYQNQEIFSLDTLPLPQNIWHAIIRCTHTRISIVFCRRVDVSFITIRPKKKYCSHVVHSWSLPIRQGNRRRKCSVLNPRSTLHHSGGCCHSNHKDWDCSDRLQISHNRYTK